MRGVRSYPNRFAPGHWIGTNERVPDRRGLCRLLFSKTEVDSAARIKNAMLDDEILDFGPTTDASKTS